VSIVFSEEDKLTEAPECEKFLFHDDPNDSDRILIWSHSKNIQVLQKSYAWGGDGTFKTCPKIYRQFYTVHGSIHSTLPMIFALLPAKTEAIYYKFWKLFFILFKKCLKKL